MPEDAWHSDWKPPTRKVAASCYKIVLPSEGLGELHKTVGILRKKNSLEILMQNANTSAQMQIALPKQNDSKDALRKLKNLFQNRFETYFRVAIIMP